ncbi:RidA family protein [Erwinia sp. E602]|uniref:Rid family hydrolase n=1 Tax=Erwinia sp. E602 TaxID=2675378 RepID=UPI001BA9F011|nr:Rid family hydrolase [Erwinia sp. E602]QUG73927.1 RidA family protein [Erwinia sp. E602]
MTQILKVKSGSPFEEKASYSRLVAVDNWVYVSNTAGRNPQSRLIPEDIREQTLQVFANIERALAAADASLADVVMSRVFIQNPEDSAVVLAVLGEKYRGINPATTITSPPLGAAEYKVEIEVTAYRGAGSAAVQEKVVG